MQIRYVTVIGLLSVAFLQFAGCQQTQDEQTPQQARLAAVENRQLKTQIAQKDTRIAQLEQQLVQCNEKITQLQSISDEKTRRVIDEAFEGVLVQTRALQQENEQLKKQLEELKSQSAPQQ